MVTSFTVGIGCAYGTVEVELPDGYTGEQLRNAVWDAIEDGKLKIKDFEVGDVW